MRRAIVGAIFFVLSGCASNYQAATPLRGVTPPANATFATQLAGPGTYLAPMPTAVVILKPDDMARNRAFCAAFMTLPTVQEEIGEIGRRAEPHLHALADPTFGRAVRTRSRLRISRRHL
jgi:hypothetical protein